MSDFSNHRKQAALVIALALATVIVVATVVFAAVDALASPARPCGLGGSNNQNREMTKCLARQPGINVDRAKAVSVGNCESGFNRHARSGSYKGIYQLTSAEFDTFQHQGPKWVDREFREYGYGIYSARGNALAALAHAHDHGWKSWSCS